VLVSLGLLVLVALQELQVGIFWQNTTAGLMLTKPTAMTACLPGVITSPVDAMKTSTRSVWRSRGWDFWAALLPGQEFGGRGEGRIVRKNG
jgi:hypothetical protein